MSSQTIPVEKTAADKAKPKVLHKVLLEEYEMLNLLSKAEADEIRSIRTEKKSEFKLLNEEEIKQEFPNKEERAEASRNQFDARRKYRFKISAELRHVLPYSEILV